MKTVDVDALAKMILEEVPLKYFYGRTLDTAHKNLNYIIELVTEFPAVDAEPVVRCKHYKDGICFFTMRRHGLHDNWYCADGEAKEPEA